MERAAWPSKNRRARFMADIFFTRFSALGSGHRSAASEVLRQTIFDKPTLSCNETDVFGLPHIIHAVEIRARCLKSVLRDTQGLSLERLQFLERALDKYLVAFQ